MEIVFVIWWVFCLVVILVIVRLLWRIAVALEKIARHLREITRAYTKNDRYSGEDL